LPLEVATQVTVDKTSRASRASSLGPSNLRRSRPLLLDVKCPRFDLFKNEENRMIDLLKVMPAVESQSAQTERLGANARPEHALEFAACSYRITS
jgi:hypothetical protein